MITEHVSEENIQLYVLDAAQLPSPVLQHMQQCVACQSKAKEYEQLFESVHSLSKPSFDFDVAALVLPQLPAEKKAVFPKLAVVVLICLLSLALISLPFVLFNYRIKDLWYNISPLVIGMISIIAVAFVGINLWDTYRRYRLQIQELNFE